MSAWELPTSATVGGNTYKINADFRDILQIISILNDPDKPEAFRWLIAMALFYEGEVQPQDAEEAVQYMAEFIAYEDTGDSKPGQSFFDWEQDASIIIADVNKVAGQEIRSIPFVHWWTFLSWFFAIGEGQLSTIVSIREKLRKGKPLEKWEKEYYQKNKSRVDLKTRYSAAEKAEQEKLKALLDG